MNIIIWDRSFFAHSDLSAKAGYLVKIVGTRIVDLAGSGDRATGVLQEPNLVDVDGLTQGRVVTVRLLGESFTVIGAAVVAGNMIGPDANGRGIPVSTGWAIGEAVESAVLAATPTGAESANVIIRGPVKVA